MTWRDNAAVPAAPLAALPAAPIPVHQPALLPPSETAWVTRLRDGDERAFELLFRAYAPGLVVFVARYTRSTAVAEELVQDVFLAVWRRRDRLAVESDVGAYLYAAARNRALSHLTRERTAARYRADDARPDSGLPAAPSDVADPRAPREDDLLAGLELQEAVAALPARCRLVFTMQRQHGMSYGEVARALGLSVKTVETQMGRALKVLRAHLGPAVTLLAVLMGA